MLDVNAAENRIQISLPGFCVKEWLAAVIVDGVEYSSKDAELSIDDSSAFSFDYTFHSIGLMWHFDIKELKNNNRLIVESCLRNVSNKGLSLEAVYLLKTTPETELGKPGIKTVHLGLEGLGVERSVIPVESEKCLRSSLIKSQFYAREIRIALQIGFTSFNRLETRVEHNYSQTRGITDLEAVCHFKGWTLKQGECTPLETLTLAVGTNPFDQLEEWADLAAEKCEPRKWEDSPIGYIGGSWVDNFFVENAEETVLRNVQAIDRRLKGFGFGYVWVSIANLADEYPGNWLEWNYKNFPSGPTEFINALTESQLKLGFWCAPFWICSALPNLVDEYQDAFLKNSNGEYIIPRPEWQFGKAGTMPRNKRPFCYALDPTHPKTLTLLKKTFETYRDWGVRYYMTDFLECAADGVGKYPYEEHFDQSIVIGPEAYHTALKVIREAAGDETYILTSTGSTVHNAGYADGIRTGNDFGEGRALAPDSYFYPGTFVVNSSEFWTGPLSALLNQASAYYLHRKLFINDSGNVLTVDKPLPLSDAQIHATIHAMSGGPSMVGDDIDRMDDERLNLIKVTLPRSRKVAFPIDLFESTSPDYPKLFHRKIEKSWGSFDIVTVYNFTDTLMDLPVDFSTLGLKSSCAYHIWEFWDCSYTGVYKESFSASVPPGTVRVYRITEDTKEPTIIGTDMHLCMGEMEIDDCRYDTINRTLTVVANRPIGENGNIFIHVPENFCVVNPKGLWIAKDGRYNTLLVRSLLSFVNATAECKVQIEQIKSGQNLTDVEP